LFFYGEIIDLVAYAVMGLTEDVGAKMWLWVGGMGRKFRTEKRKWRRRV